MSLNPMSMSVVLLGLLGWCGSITRAQAPGATKAEKVEIAQAEAETPVAIAHRLADQLRQHPASPSKASDRLALFLLDTETGRATRIADEPEPGLLFCGSVEWTHDGRRIFFDASPLQGKETHRTRLQSIERGERTPLMRHLGPGTMATGTPDGERILFLLNPGMVEGEGPGLWLMQADGSGRTKLEEFGRPRMSPDGRLCLISSFNKPTQLKLIELETALVYQIELPDEQTFSLPSWADGNTIVVMTGAASNDAITLLDVTNPALVTVKEVLWKRKLDTDFKPRSPVYSTATRRCFFIARDGDNGSAVYSFRRGQAAPPRRFESATGRKMEGLVMSPGGRYLIFCSDLAEPVKK